MLRKKADKKIKRIIAILLTASIIFCLAIMPQKYYHKAFIFAGLSSESYDTSDGFTVEFFDVGQGDFELCYSKDTVIIIDSGEKGIGDKVMNYLNDLNIKTVDYLIVTHPHSDHYGNSGRILETLNVKNLIMPYIAKKYRPNTAEFKDFIKAANKYAEKIIYSKPKALYKSSGIKIRLLAPYSQNEELNYMSVVAKISYGNISFLMTGDCGEDEEKEILENTDKNMLNADILKVGHHGSKYSSSDKWLNSVKPKEAIISCGKNNDYYQPSAELLERLEKHKIKYYRTDIDGTVKIKTDGRKYSVN